MLTYPPDTPDNFLRLSIEIPAFGHGEGLRKFMSASQLFAWFFLVRQSLRNEGLKFNPRALRANHPEMRIR